MPIFIFLVMFGTAMCETTTSMYDVPMTRDMWEADIKSHLALFAKYFKAREFTKISSLFTPNCAVLPPGAKMGIGREATALIYGTLPEAGVDSLEFNSIGVIQYRNNLATNRGEVILRTADGTTLDVCKFVVVWRVVDGKSMFDTAIWNSDTPTIINAYAV